jgi:uncharacterized membrane protein YgcG
MKDSKLTHRALLICGAVGAISLCSAGCKCDHKKQPDNNMAGFFAPADATHDVQRIAHVQAASGARADATLEPYHFDKGELNSLGREKLSLMLDDDAANNPMTIYLNVPTDDEFKAARQDAVVAYLKEQGLEETQVSFKQGTNPDSQFQAGETLTRMDKTETGTSGSGASSSPGAGGTDSGMSSGGGSAGGDTSK